MREFDKIKDLLRSLPGIDPEEDKTIKNGNIDTNKVIISNIWPIAIKLAWHTPGRSCECVVSDIVDPSNADAYLLVEYHSLYMITDGEKYAGFGISHYPNGYVRYDNMIPLPTVQQIKEFIQRTD